MSLSTQAREYMAKRDTLSDDEKQVVDVAFDQLYSSAKYLGVQAAGDDRAAELEAAMIKFIIDSRKR